MKKLNNYQNAIDPHFYALCPKSVLASIAVSLLSQGGYELSNPSFNLTDELFKEWESLAANGIVPQKAKRK